MSVDREQIRRDIESARRWVGEEVGNRLAALLAKLEQAEREANETIRKHCEMHDQLVARLLLADALAEAVTLIKDAEAGGDEWWEAHAKLYLALFDYQRGRGE